MSIPSRVLADVLLLGGLGLVVSLPALWNASAVQTASTSIITPATGPARVPGDTASSDRYNVSSHNYYAGYGTMADMDCGQIQVRGSDGLMRNVSLRTNRTMVRLCLASTEDSDPELDPDFDSAGGTPVRTFDPQMLDIGTGQHVTFYADDSVYNLQPQDANSLTQPVIIAPGVVYNWTFTQPGLYHFTASSGDGPTQDLDQGLLIQVMGDPVAFDDSAFVNALPPACFPSGSNTAPRFRVDLEDK